MLKLLLLPATHPHGHLLTLAGGCMDVPFTVLSLHRATEGHRFKTAQLLLVLLAGAQAAINNHNG